MRDPISRYVSDLDAILHFDLTEARLEEIVMEAESHLRESAARRTAEGADPEGAQATAIASYGSPQRVALGYLRRSKLKMWGLHPGYWAALGALITIVSWNFHWLTLGGYFDTFGNESPTWQIRLLGIAALILPILAARRRFRSNWAALTLATITAAALSVPLMAYWMIPPTDPQPRMFEQGISRFHLSRDLPRVQATIMKIQVCRDLLREGIRAYANADSDTQVSSLFKDPSEIARRSGNPRLEPLILGTRTLDGGRFVVPREYGAYAMVDGRTWAFETVSSFSMAKAQWAEAGPKDLHDMDNLYVGFTSLERSAMQASKGRLFFFQPDLYAQTLFGTIILLPLFLLLDGIAAWASRPRGRRRNPAIA